MKAYVNTKSKREDDTYDCYLTQEVECKTKPLWWHNKGLSFTASGYGSRIPTQYMIKYNNRWRRIYCIIYSNSGTLYIGKKYSPCLTVNIEIGG